MLDAGLTVAAVILDRTCPAAELAGGAGVTTEVVERESYGLEFDRVAYTHRVVEALKRHQIDVVAMAGFGTVLAPPIFDVYAGRFSTPIRPSCRPSRAGTLCVTPLNWA